jgi:hypothetical protein
MRNSTVSRLRDRSQDVKGLAVLPNLLRQDRMLRINVASPTQAPQTKSL